MSASPGSHRNQSPSASTFLSTLIPVGCIAGAILIVFLYMRPKYKRVYEPRTYLPLLDEHEKTPQPANSRFGWIKDFRSMDDDYILTHSSLDNYLFLRMFKVLCGICLVGSIITWPILFPVNATGGGGGTQFNVVNFYNVATPKHTNYYYAHSLLAWVFVPFIMVVITRETVLFINLRQAFMTSNAYSSRLSSKTVLFTNVAEEFRSESALRELFDGVLRVWIQPDVKELSDIVDDRDKAVAKLEAAENKLCQTFVKNRKKAEKKGKTDDIPLVDSERARIEVNQKIRPTHRLGKIPLIGKKVDTIDWARPEIQSLNEKVDTASTKAHQADKVPAVFVEFESIEFAQIAFRQTASDRKLKLTPRSLGIQPEDVLFKNLGNSNMKNRIILACATCFVIAMIIFWSIPVAFVGFISNIKSLETYSWLAWLKKIPNVILGVVTGLLPSIMLSILMALVPIVLRVLAGLFEPTHSDVELKTQSWYFAFQVVDVFLITTFSSGAASVITSIIKDPTGAPALLAQNLPTASNFYTAYFVVTMLQQAAMQVANIAPLLFILVLGKILDKTPRKVYNRYTKLIGLGWGSTYPPNAMLGCIAIAYSCIAPLLLGFATVGFGLLYLAYRYQFLYVIGNQSINMNGRAYSRMLQQLTVGVYLLEFCLVGLFAIDTASSTKSVGPLVISLLLAIATIIYHIIMKQTLDPIINFLELAPGTDNLRQHSTAHTEDGEDLKGNASPSLTVGDRTVVPNNGPGGIRGKLLHFFFHSAFAKKAFTINKPLPPHFDRSIRPYTQEEQEEAYLPPAITSQQQIVWIARDEYGLSSQEVAGCKEFNIPVSDEEATFNEKGAVQWSQENIRESPIYQEKVPY